MFFMTCGGCCKLLVEHIEQFLIGKHVLQRRGYRSVDQSSCIARVRRSGCVHGLVDDVRLVQGILSIACVCRYLGMERGEEVECPLIRVELQCLYLDLEAWFHAFRVRCDFVAEFAKSIRNARSEEHTSELQSPDHLVCRLLLEKKNEKEKHAPPSKNTLTLPHNIIT